MATLLLRLAAPLQAWGAESKFETRRTLHYPTKSGVIGMLAASLGFSRDHSLDVLNGLRFGVRIDKEGVLLRDYHTVKAEKSYTTERYYLSDAVFLAGLEGDAELLSKIETALKNPAYPLYLGRRSCPPTMPLVLGIKESPLFDALNEEPWLLADWYRKRVSYSETKLRIIIDDESSSAVLRDVPLSFSKKHREFGWRGVKDCGYCVSVGGETFEEKTEHDPFEELR